MAASFTADRRLFYTRDKRRLVAEDDPTALLLAYIPGEVVPAEDAKKYERPPAGGAAESEPRAPEPEPPVVATAPKRPRSGVSFDDGKGT